MTGEDGIVEVVLVFRFLPYPFFFSLPAVARHRSRRWPSKGACTTSTSRELSWTALGGGAPSR